MLLGFQHLPFDVIHHIARQLDVRSHDSLGKTCHSLYQQLKDENTAKQAIQVTIFILSLSHEMGRCQLTVIRRALRIPPGPAWLFRQVKPVLDRHSVGVTTRSVHCAQLYHTLHAL
jgi:hypothetical protein